MTARVVDCSFNETMVAVTAAEMRRALGLEPWPSFEASARARYQAYLAAGGYPDLDPYRRTGRSTRSALLALARCRVWGFDAIHVKGDRSAVRSVKDLVAALSLRIEVVSGNPDRLQGRHLGKTLFYRDHFVY